MLLIIAQRMLTLVVGFWHDFAIDFGAYSLNYPTFVNLFIIILKKVLLYRKNFPIRYTNLLSYADIFLRNFAKILTIISL